MRSVVVSLVVLMITVAVGSVDWVSRSDGGEFVVEIGEIEIDAAAAEDGEYILVRVPEAGFSNEIGRPMLPVYRRLVELPHGAAGELVVRSGDLRKYDIEHPVYPRQHPVPKSGPVPEFVFDEKFYSEPGFAPAIGARIVETGVVRGHRVALVEINPVSYNPVEGVVEVAHRMEVSLRWNGADWGLTRRLHERYDSPAFAGRLQGVVVNSGQLSQRRMPNGEWRMPELPVGYLIIVPDDWEANVEPLAEWRRRKGFSVFVRNLTEVGGSSAGVVRDYIKDAYDNWPIPPSFVLLVGDIGQIGYFDGQGTGSPPTDLNFGMMDAGDYFPDIDVGRASVVSAAQLDSLVSKIVSYEQNTWTGGTAWLNKQYFIASSDGGNHQIAEGTHSYVMAKLRPLGIECDSLWLYHGSGTPLTTAINGGRSWVTYSGHGGTDCWADPNPDFDINDVHGLTNVDMVPYVQTYACVSGNFASTSYPECFSESWIRTGKRGAIAHIASSVSSYWEEDDTLERRVFDCMFDSSFFWIMGGFNKAKLVYYQQMGATQETRRYFEMYNLMGDGAIDVYWHEPTGLTVTHPPVIPLGNYPLTVTVSGTDGPIEDALVCAMGVQDTAVFSSGYTDAGGEVILNVHTTSPDTVYVTVTGHNLEPYLGLALAMPSSGAYVIHLSHTVDDSAGGNNDGIINPGETINLPMWMKNWGSATAQNVVTTLRTADVSIAMLDSVKSFGDIAAGDSVHTGSDGFGFEVAGSCTNGYVLRFTISSRDANDSVWETPLSLVAGAPVLDYAGWDADDPPPGGNGNRMIEPGETGDLIITLRNTGQGNAYGVTAILRSSDSRLAVLDSLGSFGDIARDTTGNNDGDRFAVRADNSIPRETQVSCTLHITVDGLTYARAFDLDIGVIRTCDPVPDGPRTPARYYAYDIADTVYTEAPTFSWFEINGVGTQLVLDDDQTIEVSLPSGFGPLTYYGDDFGSLSICSNGWIAPGRTTVTAYSNDSFPNGEEPAMIAPCWDDLYPEVGGGVWYYHDAANHRFVVEWDSVHYYSPREAWDKFQVVIYDTTVQTETGDNVILYQYLTANHCGSSTVGIEDQDSQIGINYVFNGSYHRGAVSLEPGMAIRITTNPPLPRVGVTDSPGRLLLPDRVRLLPCVPNPCRHGMRMSFAIPRTMRASLAVFDAAGRRVVELMSGEVKPGTYSLAWDGCDAKGRRVARGIYLYRLETEGVSLSRKMVLLQ